MYLILCFFHSLFALKRSGFLKVFFTIILISWVWYRSLHFIICVHWMPKTFKVILGSVLLDYFLCYVSLRCLCFLDTVICNKPFYDTVMFYSCLNFFELNAIWFSFYVCSQIFNKVKGYIVFQFLNIIRRYSVPFEHSSALSSVCDT